MGGLEIEIIVRFMVGCRAIMPCFATRRKLPKSFVTQIIAVSFKVGSRPPPPGAIAPGRTQTPIFLDSDVEPVFCHLNSRSWFGEEVTFIDLNKYSINDFMC